MRGDVRERVGAGLFAVGEDRHRSDEELGCEVYPTGNRESTPLAIGRKATVSLL